MLALLATIAGLVITGYSASKIYSTRKGQGQKLRDMEVLRRLNIPPKKQVRAWSLLMLLGLVLLTPGLGYLLSYDPISSDGKDIASSNLKATPLGTPVMVPPSEKLDKTPRIVDKDGSSSAGFFLSSGGGGGSKRSSSGGSKTNSDPTPTESATKTDEHEAFAAAAKSDDLKGDTELKATRPLTGSDKIDTAPEKISAPVAKETSKLLDEMKPALTDEAVVDEGGHEKIPAAYVSGYSVAESEPSEKFTEPVVIDAAPEKRTSPVATGYSVAESEPSEKFTEPESIDAAPENGSVKYAAGYLEAEIEPELTPAETEDGSEAAKAEIEEGPFLNGSGSSEIGEELGSSSTPPSGEPYDAEVELALPATYPASINSDLGEDPDVSQVTSETEDPASGSITGLPVPPAAETGPQIDEVKKLEFKDDPKSEMETTGNDSDEKKPAESLLPNLDGPFGDFKTVPRLDTLGKGFTFGEEFENFTSISRPGTGVDRNSTLNAVQMMKFEKIDLGSNFRGGSGLTPSSPFG
ncbi:MAG TPA: hypothetical protein PLM24_01840 [Methanothrix sp.]|nr:hypothetical protein [Methanothrix sp.]HPJ84642.1 hypothetical protein [Methanothrix sp.]HPR65861.1 hypothetical protein [Methanothrix sp.]